MLNLFLLSKFQLMSNLTYYQFWLNSTKNENAEFTFKSGVAGKSQ